MVITCAGSSAYAKGSEGSITCTWRAVMSVPSKITSNMSSTLNASVKYLPGRGARHTEHSYAPRARFWCGDEWRWGGQGGAPC